MMKSILIWSVLMWTTFNVCAYGQTLPCGNSDVDLADPFHQRFNENVQSRIGKTNAPIRVIPVAFHIISQTAGQPANISQAQITSGINVLNAAFRGVYGGVDTEIEFCLAGLNRIQDPTHSVVQLNFNDDLAKGLSQEDPVLYLNVWTVDQLYNSGGNPIGGYTVYPKFLTQFPTLDGVLIDHRYVGNTGTAINHGVFDEGKGLVHEVGHWLNLFHTFQGGCDNGWTCGYEGDCCCDTPPQLDVYDGCRRRKNTCHDDAPDERDPINNYMNYTDDDCRTEFTECQKGRMVLTLDSIRQYSWFIQGGDCPFLRLAGTGNEDSEPTVKVFPNPISSNSVIEVQLPRTEVVSMVFFDVQGRMVERVFGPEVVKVGTLTRSFPANLATGRYFLRVLVGEDMMVKVVMIN
jgi:hypothetical protein